MPSAWWTISSSSRAAGRTTPPRCCSITCTKWASSSGTRAMRPPSPWCWSPCWRPWRCCSSSCSTRRCTTNERCTHRPAPCAPRAVRRHLAGHAGRLAAGPAVDTVAGLCVLDGLPSARILGTLRPGSALDAGELPPCLAGRALCALFPEHGRAGGHVLGGPAGAGHAGRLCLCALPLSRPGPGLCPGAGAADDHAGHPAGGELPDPVAPGRRRYAAGHRPAVLRIGLCHLFAAPDLPGHSPGTRRGRAGGGCQHPADPVARLRAAGAARVPGVRAGVGELSLEQLPVEAQDRKSTRLNSSHSQISYAVFCLKKKTQYTRTPTWRHSHNPAQLQTPAHLPLPHPHTIKDSVPRTYTAFRQPHTSARSTPDTHQP